MSALTIGSLDLVPEFDEFKISYSAVTKNTTNAITTTAKSPTGTVVIKVDGNTVSSGSSYSWASGLNEVVITVTDSTNEVSTVYTVNVYKLDARLDDFAIAGFAFDSPASFDSDTTTYVLTGNVGEAKITVETINATASFVVKLGDDDVTEDIEDGVTFTEEDTVLTVEVTDEYEGEDTTKTYTFNLTVTT